MTPLSTYDLLRLVLRVPFTPENRDQNTSFPSELPLDRQWKGECLVYHQYQGNNSVELASEVQPKMPKTEKKP